MKKYVSILLIALTLISPTLQASECKELEAECQQLAEISKYIIDEQGRIITDQDQVINTLQERVGLLIEDRDRIEREKDSWYRNPFFLIGLGFIAGVAIENQ